MEPDLVKCLEDAADLLEASELAKETFEEGSPTYAYCMIGAVRHACPDNMRRVGDGLNTELDRKLAKLLGFSDIEKAFKWNDRKVRKKEEVVARLRLAAERERLGASATSAYSGSSS